MKLQRIMEVVSIKQVTTKRQVPFELKQIKSPEDGAMIAHHYIGNEANEVFIIIMLNTKNRVIGIHRVSSGSLNASIVHPREVMKAAILNNAASIICSHCHPSGDPTQSNEDLMVTKRLVEAGELLGIDVLDHIIVTEDEKKYLSLKEKGFM